MALSYGKLADISHLEKVNSVYPHRSSNSLSLFKRLAEYNVNVGAFKDDGTLVAWIFR